MKKLVIAAALLAIGASPALAATGTSTTKAKVDSWFAKGDIDRDGYISRDEHALWSDSMFDRADTNKDGMISMTEFKAQKAKKQAARATHKQNRAARAGTNIDPAETSENDNIKDTKPH